MNHSRPGDYIEYLFFGIPFYFRKHYMDNTLNPLATYLLLPPWEKNLNPESTPRCSGCRTSIASPFVINYHIKNRNQFYISQIGIIIAKRTYTNKCLNIQHKLSKEIRICKLSAKLISCGTYVQIKKKSCSLSLKTGYYEVIQKKCKCVIGHLSSKFKLNSKINWHNNIYTCHHEIIQKKTF